MQFRMNNCSLPKPIYLVEQFGDGKHFAIPEKSLNQAIANTQVSIYLNYSNIRATELNTFAEYFEVAFQWIPSNIASVADN